jgi:hypothetical protein
MSAPPAPSRCDRPNGRINIDHQTGQLASSCSSRRERLAGDLGTLRPQHLASGRPSLRDMTERSGPEALQQPPARRVRRHRPEQLGLICQHRDIGDRPRAVGDRDRHVHQHPTRIVTRPWLLQTSQRLDKLPRQRGPIRNISKQPRAPHATPRPRRPWLRARGRVVVTCTSKVPLHPDDSRPQQSQFPLVARHFRLSGHGHADCLMKSPG